MFIGAAMTDQRHLDDSFSKKDWQIKVQCQSTGAQL
jgi:hypothetical protein